MLDEYTSGHIAGRNAQEKVARQRGYDMLPEALLNESVGEVSVFGQLWSQAR